MSDSPLASKSREELLEILNQEPVQKVHLQAIQHLRRLPVTMELIQNFLEILRRPYPSVILQQALAFLNDIAPLKQYPSLKLEILDTLSYLSKNSEENIQKICQKTIQKYHHEGTGSDTLSNIIKIILLLLAIIVGIIVLLVSACFFLFDLRI